MTGVLDDPLPLSREQLAAVGGAAVRELTWSQIAVRNEIRSWSLRAKLIPDPQLRAAALSTLANKRGHHNGAAMFAVLPRRRHAPLLRLLTALQIIWDTLDTVHELAPDETVGRRLHLALIDSLTVGDWLPSSWWSGPWRAGDDGGYLAALVQACRAAVVTLPSYASVYPLVLQEAWSAQVCAINHIADGDFRDARLRHWAALQHPDLVDDLSWWEITAAASSSLVILMLLAIAADPDLSPADAEAAQAAWWPWTGVATAMCDSWADRDDDRRTGAHSYVAHYPSEEEAQQRIQTSIALSATGLRQLPRGQYHALLLASMVALYLTADRSPESQQLLTHAGSLTRLMAPFLTVWRHVHGQTVGA